MTTDDIAAKQVAAELERIGLDAQRKLAGIATEMRTRNDEIERKSGDYADALHAVVNDRLNTLQADLDATMTVLNRTNGNFAGGGDGTKAAPLTPEDRAFSAYLRKGPEGLEPSARKSLVVGTDTQAGYLAPGAFTRELLRVQREASPLRRLARTITTASGSIEVPRQTTGATASWVGELEARPETNLTFGTVALPLHELACYVDVSLKLLDDSSFNVEDLLATDLGEAFAVAEATAFITGSGTKRPLGLLNDTGVASVPTGHATDILPDSIVNLVYSVGAANSREGSFLMSTATAGVVRKMKDTSNRYLWADASGGLVYGQPATLLGQPVVIDDNMPAIGAGSTPIVFGNFQRAFWIVTRASGGVSILADPYSVRTSGLQRFHARMRVGGGVIRPEAITKLRVAVT